MYLIFGLGNPENEYRGTRHNMGFDAVNKIAEQYHMEFTKTKFNSLYTEGNIEGKKVMLIKPQTFMNLSGVAVREFVNFYKVSQEEIIVIYDDMDIEKGIIKIRKKGGPGNHNGMKSIQKEIANNEFPRIRIGIGVPEHKNDMINYVIGKVSEEEKEILQEGVNKAAKATIEILKSGIDKAMNKYN